MLIYPEVATRSCEDCKRWVYNHQTGERVERLGQFIPRKPGEPTACQLPIGCAKGTPEDSKALNERNTQAHEHYRQCVATGRFPDDDGVAQRAALIRGVEEAVERGRLEAGHNSLKRVFGIK